MDSSLGFIPFTVLFVSGTSLASLVVGAGGFAFDLVAVIHSGSF